MFHVNQFPNDLIQQYLQACSKLKKFERVVFKRFAPNVAEVSTDFNRLALKFEEACIFQYAAMCYLGASKCEKSLGNKVIMEILCLAGTIKFSNKIYLHTGNLVGEIDFLLKSARAFVKANEEVEKLLLRSNKREYIEGALTSYSQALSRLEDDSVMKAAVIREIKKLNPSFEGTSSFSSPCHRIYDLELSAAESITSKDYVSALEKLTDIFDNITERKKESYYVDALDRIQITRLLLLLILDLPPARQSPSHIKLLEKYSSIELDDTENDPNTNIPISIQVSLKDLVMSWHEKDKSSLVDSIQELLRYESLTKQHRELLEELTLIYQT